MDQWGAFLADIIEHPEDDTPRLIAADWLEENGHPERAEFVRVQVKLACLEREKCPRCDGDGMAHGSDRPFESSGPGTYPGPCPVCRGDALRRREGELLAIHNHAWLYGPKGLATYRDGDRYGWIDKPSNEGGRVIDVEFRRGFVESVTCSAADWLAHGDEIRRCQPVTRVKFSWIHAAPESLTLRRDGDVWRSPLWRGVTFELPPVTTAVDMSGYANTRVICSRCGYSFPLGEAGLTPSGILCDDCAIVAGATAPLGVMNVEPPEEAYAAPPRADFREHIKSIEKGRGGRKRGRRR